MAKKVLTGIPVSAGISVGKAFFMNRRHFDLIPRHIVVADQVPTEIERLEWAFGEVQEEMRQAMDNIPLAIKDQVAILETHLTICRDKKLIQAAKDYTHTMGITAEWGLEKAMGDVVRKFDSIEDPYIRERVQDIRVVIERVQSRLLGQSRKEAVKSLDNRVVLMAHDLTPADTVGLELDKIMSFATVQGGKTSHTGIMARSLRIPALVGVDDLEDHIADGQLVILDGLKGRILVDPDEAELEYYSDLKYQFENYQRSIRSSCGLPGETLDGYRLNVMANIELYEEVSAVLDNGGEGIGLYRTEFAYMGKRQLPTEEELYSEYRDMVATISPRKVVLRTLDVGADKLMANQSTRYDEANPAMGLRAIRYCLKHRDLFMTQLRAILRASVHGNAAMMFPMISGLRELREAKGMLRMAQKQLDAEGLAYDPDMPVGIMVELPSAVMMAEFLAQECDFFSIGTNDLIQYSLGIDRTNHHVSYLYQPLHPAVVRSIKQVVDMAHRVGIEVNVCGELASDPYCVPILMGMQIDGISLTPQAIPGIKRVIRQTRLSDCKELLSEVLACSTVGTINQKVTQTIFKRFPEELTFFASLVDMDESVS